MAEEQKLEQPTATPPPTSEEQAVAGTDRQIKTIQDWMDMEGHRPESDEDRKKRERREKSKKIIAAVSDGIGALSNLFFTSQYAPNMYNHDKGSQMAATNARIEQLKADREKNADRYMQFSLKLGDLENQRARTLRELEAQQEAQRLAREKAEREAETHGWKALLQDDIRREQAGKADKAEQDAIAAQYEAENKPHELQLKNATENARAGSYRASAANSMASARAHDRSEAKEFTAWDENGNPHPFRTQAAAEAFAKQHGTWQEQEQEETTHTESELNGTSDTTRKKKGGYPVKPQPKPKPSPTGGTGGSGKKKSPTS